MKPCRPLRHCYHPLLDEELPLNLLVLRAWLKRDVDVLVASERTLGNVEHGLSQVVSFVCV